MLRERQKEKNIILDGRVYMTGLLSFTLRLGDVFRIGYCQRSLLNFLDNLNKKKRLKHAQKLTNYESASESETVFAMFARTRRLYSDKS